MIRRNKNMQKLKSGYLFPEINLRKKRFLALHPEAKLISLGIGDTTEPLEFSVAQEMADCASSLGKTEGYTGYGPEQGIEPLRELVASTFYQGWIDPSEVFISDGAKCDLGRLQCLFGGEISIAVQDPAYPVYIDGSIIQGVSEIRRMPCIPENGFFPDLEGTLRVDVLYICSPNNPTGTAYSRTQLETLVAYAKKQRSLIIFDAAYAAYIQDPSLPRSIYEIEGGSEVAIEISSFSKLAGFTGIRLGWTVVPEALKYEDGSSIRSDWNRITTTLFNGASIIAQQGGLAQLKRAQEQSCIGLYRENARLLKQAFEKLGMNVFGGIHAPYLWIQFPGQTSWDVFQRFLERGHLVVTPGSGFGPAGEGFIRISAYGKRDDILTAVERLLQVPGLC